MQNNIVTILSSLFKSTLNKLRPRRNLNYHKSKMNRYLLVFLVVACLFAVSCSGQRPFKSDDRQRYIERRLAALLKRGGCECSNGQQGYWSLGCANGQNDCKSSPDNPRVKCCYWP
ncbi:hypothetical protein AC249_AIPGENE10008 [Exaiptasia diaphana]|nr:hypothetical protein AC249_AIPGENE10008 [Exaiptasia diaphana]